MLLKRLAVLAGSFFVMFTGSSARAHDLLPDLVTAKWRLAFASIDTTTESGHRLLRLANSTPNLGRGPLELRGGAIVGDKQEVFQRIYRRDGSYWQRYAGTFIYHPQHGHVHFENFSQYRLRRITLDNAPGEIVAQSAKTSYCVEDSKIANPLKRGFRFKSRYSTCDGQVQGISVGWADLYKKKLYGQWIDVTNVAEGFYWLESEVDPDNLILESDETNNVARVPVYLDGGDVTVLGDISEARTGL